MKLEALYQAFLKKLCNLFNIRTLTGANAMITRQEYMQGSINLHDTYFRQFVTDSVKQRVARVIGVDRIKDSTDKHFNDIPLRLWVSMFPLGSQELRKQLGECNSFSTTVCIAKAAARMIKEENVG